MLGQSRAPEWEWLDADTQERPGTGAPGGGKGSPQREGLTGGRGAADRPRARGRDAGRNCGLERGRALRRGLLRCGPTPALHSGLGAAGAGRGGGAGRRQEDKMAAADGSFFPRPAAAAPRRKGRQRPARPDSPGRVCGGSGPGLRGFPGRMAAGRGRMAADGAALGSSRLPRSLRGWAPTNGPSGQPPPPGAPPTSRLPQRLVTPPDLHRGRSLSLRPLRSTGSSLL